MKKKISKEDQEVWDNFSKNLKNIEDKEKKNFVKNKNYHNIKIDLHGFTLDEANKEVKRFINDSYEKGIKKLIIITGKGLHSSFKDDVYSSTDMTILKNTVPEFIKNNEVMTKITKLLPAKIEDGGEGAFYVYLKKKL